MPESLPPDDEGPDPYAGQDLDGLLSGAIGYVPEELLKVIPTLDALRAPPRGADPFGEAAARAEFRRLMLAGRDGPAFAAAQAGDARTLILPAVTAGGAEPHVVLRRPHSHRRPRKRGRRWQARALVGVAAAAVVAVGATALAGTLSSQGGRPAASALNTSAASMTAGPAAPVSRGVDGSGAPVPRAKPTPASSQRSANGPAPAQLCREYFESRAGTGRRGGSPAESTLYQELKSLAKGRGGVNYYCMRRLNLWEMPQDAGNVPGPLSNDGPGQAGFQGPQNSQNSQNSQGPRNSPVTNGFPWNNGDGSGQGGNGFGFSGNQRQP
jgi:hypothetical protein